MLRDLDARLTWSDTSKRPNVLIERFPCTLNSLSALGKLLAGETEITKHGTACFVLETQLPKVSVPSLVAFYQLDRRLAAKGYDLSGGTAFERIDTIAARYARDDDLRAAAPYGGSDSGGGGHHHGLGDSSEAPASPWWTQQGFNQERFRRERAINDFFLASRGGGSVVRLFCNTHGFPRLSTFRQGDWSFCCMQCVQTEEREHGPECNVAEATAPHISPHPHPQARPAPAPTPAPAPAPAPAPTPATPAAPADVAPLPAPAPTPAPAPAPAPASTPAPPAAPADVAPTPAPAPAPAPAPTPTTPAAKRARRLLAR